MKTLRILTVLQRMDHLISLRTTGCPAEFAVKLDISERTIYYRIKILKGFGAKIQFNKCCQSYEYLDDKRFVIKYL